MDNVGKWLTVEEVYEDWKTMAKAFPFLDIGATFYNGELGDGEVYPVVSIRVVGECVSLVDPSEEDVHAGHPPAKRSPWSLGDGDFSRTLNASIERREQGIPDEWVEEWAKKFSPKRRKKKLTACGHCGPCRIGEDDCADPR